MKILQHFKDVMTNGWMVRVLRHFKHAYSSYIHQTNKCGKLLGEDSADFFAIALRVII